MNNTFSELIELLEDFNKYQDVTVPLCAAENVMSDFCKLPLGAGFQERYIMGSSYEYTTDGNFIGSEYLLPFYKMLTKYCNNLFEAKYSDTRTLTGMNCLTTILMSISKPGDNIMLLSSNYGGHASVKGICQRLSLNVFDAPYLLDEYDFDYELLNKMLVENNIQFLLPAPSDILFPFELDKVENDKVVILYDASQILGIMGANIIQNPLPKMDNMILFGGTHKTLPGPAHGIAVTNNENLFKIIDRGINPQFLRNTQMHQVISLLFCLIEFEHFGKEYQSNIVRISNVLAKYLDDIGFAIAKKGNIYSTTHQVFIECSAEKMAAIYGNAITAGVTLNTKKKALFHGGYGIRLGTQEIARYQWDDSVLAAIAEIIHLLSRDKCDFKKIEILKRNIPEKIIRFTFGEDELKTLKESLGF